MLKVQAKNFGTVAILCLEGQIVNGETEILRKVVHSLPEVSAVILDFARVTTVDAHGLGVMLALREQVEAKSSRFELMNVNQRIIMVLKLTRLDSVFEIMSGLERVASISRSQRGRVPIHGAAFAS